MCDDCRLQVVESVAPLFAATEDIPATDSPATAHTIHTATDPVATDAVATDDTEYTDQSGAVTASPAAPGVNRRELLMIGGVVVVAGGVMLALLMGRAGTQPAAAASLAGGNGAAASAPAAPKPAATAKGRWSSANRAYWTGNQRKSAAFELPAEHKVGVWMRQVQPALIVRCMGNRPEVFVFTDSAAKIEAGTEDHTVRYALDEEAEATERWPDSAEHDALFAPDGDAFVRRLMGARSMRFGYTPHNATPVTIHFNVGGLAELIEPAAKECGWK